MGGKFSQDISRTLPFPEAMWENLRTPSVSYFYRKVSHLLLSRSLSSVCFCKDTYFWISCLPGPPNEDNSIELILKVLLFSHKNHIIKLEELGGIFFGGDLPTALAKLYNLGGHGDRMRS